MSNKEPEKLITFKQFIYTCNIRSCYNNSEGKLIQDNVAIRIFPPNWTGSKLEHSYIDLGWYDYTKKSYIWEQLEKTLSKDILESVVESFSYNEDFHEIFVYLQNNTNTFKYLTDLD